MSISFGSVALLCILSAAVLGFSIVLSFFLFMWCGCCHVSDDDIEDGGRHHPRGGRNEVTIGENGEPPVPDPERKGIPLNSKPPRLTPEQELLRDKALEKYKRRKARQERRQARLVAREARVANQREGSNDEGAEDLDDCDGASSVTSRTTLTSAATTVRTASTAAYGRGSYLLPPPHLCGVDMNDDDDEDGEELRSVQSHNSRRSSGTAKSKASQGTVATIKSYMRHRQRQRLRRREEQQQVELFNQWAQAQMASSSELSPSSKSSGVSSAASQEGREDAKGHHNTHHRSHRRASGTRNGNGDRSQRHRGTLESSFNGGFEYRSAQPRQRSSSVASSAPRPPEEILGEDHARCAFLQGNGTATAPTAAAATKVLKGAGGSDASREQAHLQAGFPATPNTFRVHSDFTSRAAHDVRGGGGEIAEDNTGAAVPPTHPPPNRSMHVDPLPPPPPPRRQRRTWKAVEHSAALSGFFNSPANNSFGGLDGHYDDGEVPAPFRGTTGEPSHSPAGQPHLPRE